MIRLKRIYEPVDRTDGLRILVERLWPRGISKQSAHVDLWLKDIAPSAALRTWYGHDVEKWPEFVRRYGTELRNNVAVEELCRLTTDNEHVTFVYAARDEEHNSAQALKRFVGRKLSK
jgi:uncharacterized protein YeaO (DUF488 family)